MIRALADAGAAAAAERGGRAPGRGASSTATSATSPTSPSPGPLLPLHPRLPGRPRGIAARLASAARPQPRARARSGSRTSASSGRSSEIEGDPETVAAARARSKRAPPRLLDELRLSLDFYGAQEGAVPVERIVLCGPGSAIPGLAERMEPASGCRSRVGRPPALAGLDAAAAARLTLPYGLALES